VVWNSLQKRVEQRKLEEINYTPHIAVVFNSRDILDFGLSRRGGELIQQGLAVAGRSFQPLAAGFGVDEILACPDVAADEGQHIGKRCVGLGASS
jgi:hypothetical protein